MALDIHHRTLDLPGLRMHLVEAGQGDPVLLLHGFPQHWWEWREVIPPLAEHYRVIAPDLRGAGETEAPADGYTRDQLQADVINLLDALELPKVRLIAHDWSAIIGFQLALGHPERVEQFVSLAIPHLWITFRPAMLAGLWRMWFQPVVATRGLGPRMLAGGNQRLAKHLLSMIRPPLSDSDLDRFLAPLRDPAHAAAGSALYRDFILPEVGRLSRGAYADEHLSVPTRVLYGADDPGVRAAWIGGHETHADDLTFEAVPDAGHFVADDRPDAVAASALAFFGARQNRPPG